MRQEIECRFCDALIDTRWKINGKDNENYIHGFSALDIVVGCPECGEVQSPERVYRVTGIPMV